MMQRKNVSGLVAVLMVATSIAVWSGLAHANGTGTHGITRMPVSSASIEDAIRIKERPGGQVEVGRITVQPGGHTPWHSHPGPHIVSVVFGTVEVYETDCTFQSYPAGTGFFDPGPTVHPHVHTLRNPSLTDVAEIVVVDVRSDDPRLLIAADPQPAPCFS